MTLTRQQRLRRPQGCGLASAGRTLDHDQLPITSQDADDRSLTGVDPTQSTSLQPDPSGGVLGAPGDAADEVRLDVQYVLRGQRPDVLRHIGRGKQPDAACGGAGGDVLGELDP
ncbi:MAG: hypothetical protein M3445_03520, partial [Actinomycetota bacterium]|nr:hypothetical protein [Actinomycetota bacterium]